jgi:hypothetical protein
MTRVKTMDSANSTGVFKVQEMADNPKAAWEQFASLTKGEGVGSARVTAMSMMRQAVCSNA